MRSIDRVKVLRLLETVVQTQLAPRNTVTSLVPVSTTLVCRVTRATASNRRPAAQTTTRARDRIRHTRHLRATQHSATLMASVVAIKSSCSRPETPSRCLKDRAVQYRNLPRIAELVLAKLRSLVELHQGLELARELQEVTLWLAHRTHSRSHGTQPRHRSSVFRSQDRDKMMVKILKEVPILDDQVLKIHHQKTISSVQAITEESTRNWDQ